MVKGNARFSIAGLLPNLFQPALIVALFLFFGVLQPNVFTWGNVSNLAIQSSYLTVFALAQTFVVIVRGFDLSLGTTVSLISVGASMVMVWVAAATGSDLVALSAGIAAGIAIGLLVGTINGFVVAAWQLNPFIVTLATLNICMGFATTISGGFQIFNVPNILNDVFYKASVLGIPAPVAACIVLLAVSHLVLTRLRLGRALFLIGSNPRAAVIAGLPMKKYTLLAYVLCSGIVALGALLLTARTGSGEPNLGGNLMLESIAAAVMGGASLRGGKGNVASPIFGALVITVLSNGMNLVRIDGYIQQIILGMVITATVALQALSEGKRAAK
ncbi:ABC transporter permease [Mesorhizobium sp. M7A.F.Ca.US.006.01.1.1]|nr:ABC transporter permease [Mesorhizobium sp. M7A.F.Ca.US.006.01.1.1]